MQPVSFLFISQELMVMDNIIWWIRRDLSAEVWQETWMWPPPPTTQPHRQICSTFVPPLHLQYALILDNERSLEGEATAEITDPL